MRLLSRDILKSYLFAAFALASKSHGAKSPVLSISSPVSPPSPPSWALFVLARSFVRQEIATITIGELLSKNRSRFGGSAFLLSRADAGGAGVRRGPPGGGDSGAGGTGWRKEGAAPGRIAPAGCEITLLIPAASFVSTPFRFPRKPLLFAPTVYLVNI